MTLSRWDKIIRGVKFLIGVMIFLLSCAGLAAYSYSFREKKIVHSRIMTVYSAFIIIVFTLAYTQHLFSEYTSNQFDIRNAEKLYSYLNILSAIVSFLNSFIVTNTAVRIFREVELFDTLTYFHVDESIIKSSVWVILIKSIVFPVALEVTLILRQMRDEPNKNVLWTFHALLPWVIGNLVPNCYFGVLVISKQLLLVINRSIQDIAKEVNCMQTKLQMELQKPYYRMQRFCDLADKLDALSAKYEMITKLTVEFIDLLAAPFIFSLLCNLFGITAGLFAHYHAIADALINEEIYDTFNALTNSVFLVISVAEIGLQAHLSNDSLINSKQTGYILQRMNLLHADIRFKQSVEEFSLLLLVRKYKIQPWGLLEINVSLMHDVLSAVTSFLLILIQSDLALRFSLK